MPRQRSMLLGESACILTVLSLWRHSQGSIARACWGSCCMHSTCLAVAIPALASGEPGRAGSGWRVLLPACRAGGAAQQPRRPGGEPAHVGQGAAGPADPGGLLHLTQPGLWGLAHQPCCDIHPAPCRALLQQPGPRDAAHAHASSGCTPGRWRDELCKQLPAAALHAGAGTAAWL